MSIDRNKFKMTVSDSKAYTESTGYLKKDFKPMYIDWDKVPAVPIYKEAVCKDANDFKENIGTIIPYIIEDHKNAWVASGKKIIGNLTYVNRVIRHSYVGDNDVNLICNAAMYGRKCPLCEQKFAMKKGKPEGWLVPKHLSFLNNSIRDIYLFRPTIGEQAGQLTLLDVSNYSFTVPFAEALTNFTQRRKRELQRIYDVQQQELQAGRPIQGKLITKSDINDMPEFCDVEHGYDISFTIRPERKAGYTLNKYSGFEFIPREPLTEDILEKTFDISKYFILTDEATVEKLMQESLNKAVDTANGVEVATDADDTDFTYKEKEEVLKDTPFDGGTPIHTAPVTTAAPVTQPCTTTIPMPQANAPEHPTTAISDCPYNISKKNSAFQCMSCPPTVKNACTRN